MSVVNVNIEDTSMEILARIARVEARKYDCSLEINFSDQNREVNLVGDDTYVPYILEDVQKMFTK